MALQKDKTLIGLFVVGALSLICVSIILIGSGFFSGKTASFVLYFNTSLRGLYVGSPVYFSGVRVGKVSSIHISSNINTLEFNIPVIIELEVNAADDKKDVADENQHFTTYMETSQSLDTLILKGLRAKLGTASMITGQLVIELVMIKNPGPLNLKKFTPYNGIPQLPTIASPFDSVLAQIQDLPIDALAKQGLDALTSLTVAINEMEIGELSSTMQESLRLANGQMVKMDVLQTQLTNTVERYGEMANIVNGRLDGILQKIDYTLNNMDALTKNGTLLLKNTSVLFRADSVIMQELLMTMSTLQDAAKSVSYLAKLLERTPDALIFGKGR